MKHSQSEYGFRKVLWLLLTDEKKVIAAAEAGEKIFLN